MKENIYIRTFGYLDELYAVCRANDGLLLIVSTADETEIIVEKRRIQLEKYHAIIHRCGETEDIGTVGGQAVFLVLSGRLPAQYIQASKMGTVIPFSASDTLAGRIRRLQAALDYGKQPDEKKLIELGFGLMLDIWAHRVIEKRVPKAVSDAIAIVDNDYGQLYGVDDLADRVGVSKNHLIRLFRASMKMTPGAYLEKTRMEKAKALLVSADFDMEMVANLCGYSCANYFSKVFKKNHGVSPSEYANMNTGVSDAQLPNELYL